MRSAIWSFELHPPRSRKRLESRPAEMGAAAPPELRLVVLAAPGALAPPETQMPPLHLAGTEMSRLPLVPVIPIRNKVASKVQCGRALTFTLMLAKVFYIREPAKVRDASLGMFLSPDSTPPQQRVSRQEQIQLRKREKAPLRGAAHSGDPETQRFRLEQGAPLVTSTPGQLWYPVRRQRKRWFLVIARILTVIRARHLLILVRYLPSRCLAALREAPFMQWNRIISP